MAIDRRPLTRTSRRNLELSDSPAAPPVAIRSADTGEIPLGACTSDPDRWTTRADEGAKELCRACPRRWLCAQEACRTPGAEGLWAGIFIPQTGRARQFALRQLRSLAERNAPSIKKVG